MEYDKTFFKVARKEMLIGSNTETNIDIKINVVKGSVFG